MANAAAARQGDRTPAADAAPAADFAELRSLIVGPEQRQLRTIQTRLDDPATQARDVSRVLPVAMLVNYQMYAIQSAMFASQGLKVRKNLVGFLGYVLLYGAVLQPACVVGYFKEFLKTRKTWGTK